MKKSGRPNKADKKVAFVAMKFSGNSWQDQRYLAICEVLKEAGYEPIRADQIPGSGQVVKEVCDYLKNSPLVIIDSTGDSHSVSYEIGYCHGIDRDPETTILIREDDGTPIPFNFRHFRHRIYKNSRQLKPLLREALNQSSPLLDDQFGYVFTFSVPKDARDYAPLVRNIVLDTVKYFDFTGRCELYDDDGLLGGHHCYWIALGLKFPRIKNPAPDYHWWMKFYERLSAEIDKKTPLKLEEALSEMAEMGGIRNDKKPCGVYEFHQGKNYKFIEADEWEREASVLDALSPTESENDPLG